jgi:hypothetical protein
VNAVSPARTLSSKASGSTLRLRWWKIIGGIVLPLVAAVGQVSLLKRRHRGAVAVVELCVTRRCSSARRHQRFGQSGSPRISMWRESWLRGRLVAQRSRSFALQLFFVWPVALVLICLTAFAAAYVNGRRGVQLSRQGSGARWEALALGALIIFLPPAAAQFAEARWLAAIDQQLWSHDTNAVAAGLRSLNEYPCVWDASTNTCANGP